jgi:hypothetical protein
MVNGKNILQSEYFKQDKTGSSPFKYGCREIQSDLSGMMA